MPINGKTLAQKISRLEVMNSSLKANSADLPAITTDQAQLEDVITHAKALQVLQESQKAQLQQTTLLLQGFAKTGTQLRSRLGSTLRGRYGLDSKKLIEFGLKPRVFTGRRMKAPTTAPETSATPTPPATTASPQALGSNTTPAKA